MIDLPVNPNLHKKKVHLAAIFFLFFSLFFSSPTYAFFNSPAEDLHELINEICHYKGGVTFSVIYWNSSMGKNIKRECKGSSYASDDKNIQREQVESTLDLFYKVSEDFSIVIRANLILINERNKRIRRSYKKES